MELVNKTGKRRRGKCKKWQDSHIFPQDGPPLPAVVPQRKEEPVEQAETLVRMDRLGLSPLHVACLHGQLATVQLLIESGLWWINSADAPEGQRPIHMVLSGRSAPKTHACLIYLLEHGADVNVTTDSGQTPLHLAASEGLLDCTQTLVQAGADMSAQDTMGCTPLDMARIWGHREVARYLKNCMWQKNKRKESEERKQVQVLYSELVDTVKLNKRALNKDKVAEWMKTKGLPSIKEDAPRVLVGQNHIQCLPSEQSSPNPKPARGKYEHQPCGCPEDKHAESTLTPAPRPWTIYTGLNPAKPLMEPNLQDKVSVWRDRISGQTQYTTEWNATPWPAPNLPLDTIERVFFPRAYPPRIGSLADFEPRNILKVQHRGYPPGRSTSPWTEVAMHLAEELEPGHY
ncbi:ankyrin repeat domain-containing protein 53 [Sphaeramia orbicularis]|uniref:ankyrin repeat domain-containing protein 53 n=1 Tax=Sphaeramia orbicularis TaxID=375764 RepID=UPI00117D7693|nr:ankyrin repeat domain-containing protein 53 [Sphaeramia orbicularis]